MNKLRIIKRRSIKSRAGGLVHGRRSVGDGGGGGGRGGGGTRAPPHFSAWGDSIGIVSPTFQFRKIAGHVA